MRGGTLFSGIGAPEQAMAWVDWRWCAEVDPFASAVLAARHPDTRNLGDITKVDWDEIAHTEPVDLMVFGSPCQSFSLAGKRRGMDDARGNLAIVALGVVQKVRPRWFVFENVPGLLSSAGGRDFGAFLGQVEKCGYGWAYRTLNAVQFGVPQRRRRLFLVGYRSPNSNLGDWRPAAAVLFDASCLYGHSQAGRRAKSKAAGHAAVGTLRGGGTSNCDYRSVVAYPLDLRNTRRDRPGMGLGEDGEPAPTCTAGSPAGVAYVFQPRISRAGRGQPSIIVPALTGANAGATSDGRPCVVIRSPSGRQTMVRRFTPREYERLQGFPDDYTLVSFQGEPASDTRRYQALGNSMAVPVIAWIGQRISKMDALISHTHLVHRPRMRKESRAV